MLDHELQLAAHNYAGGDRRITERGQTPRDVFVARQEPATVIGIEQALGPYGLPGRVDLGEARLNVIARPRAGVGEERAGGGVP